MVPLKDIRGTQQLVEHISAVMYKHTTIVELMEVLFSIQSASWHIRRATSKENPHYPVVGGIAGTPYSSRLGQSQI
jgi:hypothetical protein